jgi:hypothetical protein
LGQRVAVGLEAGRVEASVLPSAASESFAVEAGTWRVAVHGTVFSVERHAASVFVRVARGKVMVTSVRQPEGNGGMLIEAPLSANFPLVPEASPASLSTHGNGATAAPAVSRPKAEPAAVPTPNHTTTDDELKLDEHPSNAEQQTALDLVRAAAARCLTQQAGSRGTDSQVSVRLDTQLTLTIGPSGAIAKTVFDPPVSNSMLQCIRNETADWSTSRTRAGCVATRSLIIGP